MFSIFDHETAAPFEDRLQIPTNTSNLTIPLDYLASPPTIDESSNTANTNQIPAQFHTTVLIPKMRALIRDSRGQSDGVQWDAKAEQGLRAMKRELLPPGASQTSQLPRFFGG